MYETPVAVAAAALMTLYGWTLACLGMLMLGIWVGLTLAIGEWASPGALALGLALLPWAVFIAPWMALLHLALLLSFALPLQSDTPAARFTGLGVIFTSSAGAYWLLPVSIGAISF